MKRVYADERYCVNCHLCQVGCVTAHSRSKDVVRAYKREGLKGTERVIVEESHPRSQALQCRHCDQPHCVDACIAGAMTKDPETGIVSCDIERCVGCWSCIVACPYGVIRQGETNGRKHALKCDLCQGREIPACVEICPNRALVFAEEGVNRSCAS